MEVEVEVATCRNVAMGRGQFPNRVKSNQPYGRGLLTLNGTDPLPTAPDLCNVDTVPTGRQPGTFPADAPLTLLGGTGFNLWRSKGHIAKRQF